MVHIFGNQMKETTIPLGEVGSLLYEASDIAAAYSWLLGLGLDVRLTTTGTSVSMRLAPKQR